MSCSAKNSIILLLTILIIWPIPLQAEEPVELDEPITNNPDKPVDPADDRNYFEELGFYDLEAMLDVEVDVASLFKEDELVVGSTVARITQEQWKKQGARRQHEALNNVTSIVSFPLFFGIHLLAIRGYSTVSSDHGISSLLDGVPYNELRRGSGAFAIPNWELGTLDRIEVIKGPGSAIYGSDAFHGVISLKTFESDKDHYGVEGAGAYPLYGDGNLKISTDFGPSNLLRIDTSVSLSYQDDQNLEYEYDDPTGFTLMGVTLPASKGTGIHQYKYNSKSGVVKLRILPREKLNFKVGAYISKGEYEEFPCIVSNVIGFADTKTFINMQDLDLSWNDMLFLMTNGIVTYELPNNISVELSGYTWQASHEGKFKSPPKDFGIFWIENEKVNRTGGQVIVKQPDNALGLQWLFAYSYTYMEIKQADSKIVVNGSQTFSSEIDATQGYSRNINSAFCQIKWGILKDKLYVLAGGRNDYYSDFGNQITPRAGLIFLPSKKSSVKALYGRAFRAPAATEIKGIKGYALGDDNLKPEIIDSYEFIYMYKEKKWKGSVNAFYSYWKNGIISVDAAPDETEYFKRNVNSGKNDSIGGEISLLYQMKPYAVDLGFSYVRSRALDTQGPESTDEPGETKDQIYNTFPEYSIIAGIYYTLKPLDINFYLNNIIYLKMKEYPPEYKQYPDSLPQYYRMDLNISKTISNKLDLYLNVRNLLNRENRKPSVYGHENGLVEPGISVMLRAGYKL